MSGIPIKKVSEVWKYMKEVEGKILCNICNRQLSYSSLSNLRKHLNARHPEIGLKSSKNIEMVNMENFQLNDSFVDNDDFLDTHNDLLSSDDEALVKIGRLNRRPSAKRSNLTKERYIKKEPIYHENAIKESPKAKRKYQSEDLQRFDITDECEAYSKSLTMQLCKLNNNQRFIAERLISEVVFCGRFGKLSEDTQLSNANGSQNTTMPTEQTESQKQQVCFKYNGETIFVQNLNEACGGESNLMNIDKSNVDIKQSTSKKDILL